jgi:hypothetical protein
MLPDGSFIQFIHRADCSFSHSTHRLVKHTSSLSCSHGFPGTFNLVDPIEAAGRHMSSMAGTLAPPNKTIGVVVAVDLLRYPTTSPLV